MWACMCIYIYIHIYTHINHYYISTLYFIILSIQLNTRIYRDGRSFFARVCTSRLRIWMPIELKKHSDIRFDACSLYCPQSSSTAAKMTQFPQWSKETCSKTISFENSHFKLSCGAIAYISPLVSSVKWQLMSFINMLNRPFSPSFCSCSVHCKVTSSGIFLIASQLCHWAHLELHLYANSGLWGWEEGSTLDNSKCINSTWSKSGPTRAVLWLRRLGLEA